MTISWAAGQTSFLPMAIGIAVFSAGVALGMLIFSLLLAYPLIKIRAESLGRAVNIIVGLLSLAYGAMLLFGLTKASLALCVESIKSVGKNKITPIYQLGLSSSLVGSGLGVAEACVQITAGPFGILHLQKFPYLRILVSEYSMGRLQDVYRPPQVSIVTGSLPISLIMVHKIFKNN